MHAGNGQDVHAADRFEILEDPRRDICLVANEDGLIQAAGLFVQGVVKKQGKPETYFFRQKSELLERMVAGGAWQFMDFADPYRTFYPAGYPDSLIGQELLIVETPGSGTGMDPREKRFSHQQIAGLQVGGRSAFYGQLYQPECINGYCAAVRKYAEGVVYAVNRNEKAGFCPVLSINY